MGGEGGDADWGVALVGLAVHGWGVGPVVGEGKRVVRFVVEKELAKHGSYPAVRANGPHLEEFVLGEEGSEDFFPVHGVGGEGTIAHGRELSFLGGL